MSNESDELLRLLTIGDENEIEQAKIAKDKIDQEKKIKW